MNLSFFRLMPFVAALSFVAGIDNANASIQIDQQPLFTIAGQTPLIMMVMSRDEQLYNKAYSDYSDLHQGEPGDTGRLNTTYDDTFNYSGYFGSNLCYSYSSSVFAVDSVASGTNNHACAGKWSGNFLNWVTMSRLDVVRSVLYGGLRSTDTANTTTSKTVLERAAIPNDLHAWVKIYSGSDINSFTPYTGPTSFCNASFNGDTNPRMRVASGEWTEWASTSGGQCVWGDGDRPADPGNSNFVVRVDVCDATDTTKLESFCRPYTRSNGTIKYKPAGLLQEYGEDGKIRFGLMTGSYADPRSGGRLRRNIGALAGNPGSKTDGTCAAGDEIDLTTGKFCNQNDATKEGIINTLNQFRLVGWDGSDWSGGVAGAAYSDSCSSYGGRARNNGNPTWYLDNPGGGNSRHCSAWGNPLSELYAEALRYIEGDGNTPTSGFVTGADTSYLSKISDLIGWKDPYGSTASGGLGNPYCAKCSILVLSTGLNTFDSDEIPTDSRGIDAKGATTEVGAAEGINGGNYLVGRVLGKGGSPTSLTIGANVDTPSDICTSKTVDALGNAIGLCPDVPSQEGSYYVAGLAYKAWTMDMRPDLTSSPIAAKPSTYKNQVKTFAVSLAENLPSFAIPVAGSTVSFSPLCQSNTSGTATLANGGWGSCRLSASIKAGVKTAKINPNYTYGRDLIYDATAKGYTAGSYSFVWEDSSYGSDDDLDVTQVVTWCVGAACSYQSAQTIAGTRKDSNGNQYKGYDICWRSTSTACPANGKPNVAANEVLIRTEITSTAGGYAMSSGYNISGTTSDGPQKTDLATKCGNGGANNGSSGMGFFTILSNTGNGMTGMKDPPACWGVPTVKKFTAGTSSAKRLENPLWYAAKYGSFTDSNNNGKPDSGEWDSQQAGVPDNFFAVTNPSKLKTQLAKVFDQVIADARPTASVATSTPRIVSGSTLVYVASYDAKDWSGDVSAYNLLTSGVFDSANTVWKASDKLPAAADRKIFTSKAAATGATSFDGLGIGFDTATLASEPAIETKLLTGLDSATYNIDDLINYLRGDRSKEANQTPPGPYRVRSTPIGDILNSSPAVVGVTSYGYGQILQFVEPAQAASYAAFVAGKTSYFGSNSEKPVIFVGANDGMMHAFDGSASGGKELFAYMPNGVQGVVGQLATPGYAHRYFVDGTPTVTDAYLDGWKSVLAASTGAGGRSVFALDVTDPKHFAKEDVLWELNSDSPDADASKMGQSIGRPWVGYADDGNWIATFGNGYNSADGKAYLFIRKLSDGSNIATLAAGEPCAAHEDNCDPASNGLSMAVLVDNDGNGGGDTIYAGDYLGNLWRFEYVSGSWRLGNGGNPLFVAKDASGKRQSITSGVYTASNPLGGTMVVFGTGRYLSQNDADQSQIGTGTRASVDTVYGVWDSRVCQGVATNGSNVKCSTWAESPQTVTRASLQSQEFQSYSPLQSNGSGGELTATKNGVDYGTGTGQKMGWYLDLSYKAGTAPDALAGTRVVARPDGILNDTVINIMQPEGTTCEPGVMNMTLVLDTLTGAADYVPVGGGGARNLAGILTYRGPPPGEPPITVSTGASMIGSGDGLPPPPGQISAYCQQHPDDENCVINPAYEPPVTLDQCSWVSPNPSGRPPGKPMPCGRISWKQLQ